MRWKALLLVVLVVLAGTALSATCTTYPNSSAADFPIEMGGPACASTGPGCQECLDFFSNGSFRDCYSSSPWDVYCFWYGAENEQL
jgi:hypothetical protein